MELIKVSLLILRACTSRTTPSLHFRVSKRKCESLQEVLESTSQIKLKVLTQDKQNHLALHI